MNKATLHKTEMELVYLLEEGNLTREKIIDKFTDLMNEKQELIQGKNILKKCSGALFHKLRLHLLENPNFSSEEMEEILESVVIAEELE